MARPIKEGLVYFSHDVDMSGSLEVQALEAKFKNNGYAVYLKLLEEIYNKGYQLEMTTVNELVLLRKCNLDGEQDKGLFKEIVLFCCDIDLFDKKTYQKKNILTSDEIKNRAMVVFKKRGRIPTELLKLTNNSNGRSGVVSGAETNRNNTETTAAGDDNPQSKVKKSIVKESTEEHISKICIETNINRLIYFRVSI